MLDLKLFRNPRFSASSASISLAFFALFGVIFFLTQYLQEVRGYSALDAGLRTLPVAAGLVIGGPLSAKLTERLRDPDRRAVRPDRGLGGALPADVGRRRRPATA